MRLLKVIFIFALLAISFSGFSQGLSDANVSDSKLATLELTINDGEKVVISNINPNTRVDIFSVIGSKVSSMTVKSGICEGSITLPKGYYIIKVDNTTRKIAVK